MKPTPPDGFVCAGCGEPAPRADAPCPACNGQVALEGRYALRAIVGQGAVGTTWRADDLESGEVVAVKEMPIRPGTPLHVRDRMAREARVLREIDHDRIPTYVASFESGTGRHRSFYVVTDFIDGPTLAEYMTSRRLTQSEIISLLDEVLAVLTYLHRLAPPVIHRDLKPGNIIRRERDGALVLIDFGAVRDAVTDPRTGGSTVAGTYGFMAPEQFRGLATPATDLYAVGAMAVAMLSRRDVLDLVGADHRLAWRDTLTAAPGLVAIIEALLADEPDQRPASAEIVRRQLKAVDLDARAPQPIGDRVAALPPGLPKETVERLKSGLAVDEPVRWARQPHPDRWPKGGCALVAFAIPWTAFAIFWTVMASSAVAEAGLIGIFFPLFGLPFVAVGVFMLSAPFRARSIHRRLLYAITDRQALVVRGPIWPKMLDGFAGDPIKRYRGATLAAVERRDHGDGTSSFILARTKGNKGSVTEQGFLHTFDSDIVDDLLRRAARYGET